MARNDLILRIGADDSALVKSLKRLNNSMASFGDRLENVGQNLSLKFTAPLALAGAASVKTFAQFDKLEKGLAAITGSLPEAQKQFGTLLDIVKDTRTTLDLKTAAQASLQLQAVGRDARSVENTLRQLGIAATLAGSSSDDVGEVARQLSQAAAKGKIMQEELTGILERIPSLAAVIKNEFGTVTAEGLRDAGVSADEFINRLTSAIEKNERFQSVQGGLSKSIETFGINLQIAGAQLGKTISETIGLENILNTVSGTLSNLIDGFANLSSGTKTVILAVGGLLAALGPVSFAIGAVSKFLPFLRVGFLALLNPISLVLVALGAIAAAFLLTRSNAQDATTAFNNQKAKVDELENTLPGLISRYKELKEKTNKSAEEQNELKTVIGKIGEIVPTAITGFDNYGKALDISTEKVASFVAGQKILLQQQNQEAINKNTDALEKYNDELERTQRALSQRNDAGQLTKTQGITTGFGGTQTFDVSLSEGEIRKLQARAAELEKQINGTTSAIQILKGEFVGIEPEAPDDSNGDDDKGSGAAEAQLKALKDLRKEIALVEQRYQLFGDAIDVTKEKTDIYTNGLDKLLEAGFKPTSAAVQGIVSSLGELQGQTEALATLPTLDLIPDSVNFDKQAESAKELIGVMQSAVNPVTKMGEAFNKIKTESDLFGETYDELGEKQTALNQIMLNALESGYSPTHSIMLLLKEALAGVNAEIEKQKSLIEATAAAANVYKSAFEDASSSQVLGFKSVARAALDSAKSVVKAKIQEATAAYFADAFAKFGIFGAILAAGAGAVVGGLFGATIGKINIPGLAEGGVVTKPTLALIGEGRESEAVLPLSKLNALVSGGGGQAQELVARIDGEDLYFLLRRVERTQNRIG